MIWSCFSCYIVGFIKDIKKIIKEKNPNKITEMVVLPLMEDPVPILVDLIFQYIFIL